MTRLLIHALPLQIILEVQPTEAKKPRLAPYLLKPYTYDPATSIGPDLRQELS